MLAHGYRSRQADRHSRNAGFHVFTKTRNALELTTDVSCKSTTKNKHAMLNAHLTTDVSCRIDSRGAGDPYETVATEEAPDQLDHGQTPRSATDCCDEGGDTETCCRGQKTICTRHDQKPQSGTDCQQ